MAFRASQLGTTTGTDTGTDIDGRIRVRGSPAKRLPDQLGPLADKSVDAGR